MHIDTSASLADAMLPFFLIGAGVSIVLIGITLDRTLTRAAHSRVLKKILESIGLGIAIIDETLT